MDEEEEEEEEEEDESDECGVEVVVAVAVEVDWRVSTRRMRVRPTRPRASSKRSMAAIFTRLLRTNDAIAADCLLVLLLV